MSLSFTGQLKWSFTLQNQCCVGERWCTQRALWVGSAAGTVAWVTGEVIVPDLALRIGFRCTAVRKGWGHFRRPRLWRNGRDALWLELEPSGEEFRPCGWGLGMIHWETLVGAKYLPGQGISNLFCGEWVEVFEQEMRALRWLKQGRLLMWRAVAYISEGLN